MKKKIILISTVLIVAVMSLVTLSFAGESKNGKTSLRLENSIHNTDTDYNYDSDDLSVRMLYDQKNGYVYLVDGLNGTITSVQAENKRTGEETGVELISQENDPSFVYGNIASAVLSPDGSMLAASLESVKSESQGRIILFECEEEGNLKYIGMAPAGVRPGTIAFSEDNCMVLTADRGSLLSEENPAENMKGSVTVADIRLMKRLTSNSSDNSNCQDESWGGVSVIIRLSDTNSNGRTSLSDQGSRDALSGKNEESSDDLKSEITIAGKEAYLLIPEKNMIFTIDLSAKKITNCSSLESF